ncbi:integral membrane sensor signal transduction histidine kinase [Acetobacter aceti NRIC 0242]|uniref:histidine kinase n=3 Tax=Acetobacter aceti TaxID=435 RepID=A0A6S6PHF9_ACEAC|nr:HAMP domain-containing sensor histidine kinase [Acetobacter aceti]TCS33573.1 hypothetical protein EDC15_10622 [Acetobacter aceti NBRC 14818]GBO80902.1 integral membrane sensor signal transduction histidine kinase [Acetobacter aceti NRIC 0242]BCI67288.1 hypothetical protein AAJCM20276_19120 [Acetobacter aceti]BCK74831.1 hypothetical protein EMQ_0437 [Acetobacter aceti NBRC 14818]GAN57208.1 two component sensor histidine kinase EnvZ [Acetobacter aceti NBRC 14818]
MSLLLTVGFVGLAVMGLVVETMDRITFHERFVAHQDLLRTLMIYRSVAEDPPAERDQELRELDPPSSFSVRLADEPDMDMVRQESWLEFQKLFFVPEGFRNSPLDDMAGPGGPHPGPPPFQLRFFRNGTHAPLFGGGGGGPPELCHDLTHQGPDGSFNGEPQHSADPQCLGPSLEQRRLKDLLFPFPPKRVAWLPDHRKRYRGLAFQLPNDTRWLVIRYRLPAPNPFNSATFPLALGLMTVGSGLLIVWGVRRLLLPVRTLSAAAAAFAPDAASPPLSEEGPLEVAQAAAAFNAMAARIRRFISERTRILSAVGHDLRTPITRMKLRAEFIEDDEMREKFLHDINELMCLVEATLEFSKDSSASEPLITLDLHALLQTVVDDVAESRPADADRIILADFNGTVMTKGRPMGLKRAFTNLINNAVNYGGNAMVTIRPPRNGRVTVTVEDDGPGLPKDDLERMFEAFVRGEESRNRETGGTGLGLAITRTIIRGQGGDVVLHNRKPNGLRAVVTLVA